MQFAIVIVPPAAADGKPPQVSTPAGGALFLHLLDHI
jgi:hypothetical protein